MICPICTQHGLVPIWYGMPTSNEIFLAREDKLVLGGTKEKEAEYFCLYCQEPAII